MAETHDIFWKWFLAITAGLTGLGIFAVAFLFARPYPAVSVPVGEETDPYTFTEPPVPQAPLTSYFYRESLPLGFDDVSWNAHVTWRSQRHYAEGEYSARVGFFEGGAGVGVLGGPVPVRLSSGIALDLYVEEGGPDVLYLELYDPYGATIGRQELGWYFPEGRLVSGRWQRLSLPIANFSTSTLPFALGGFAIVSDHAGVAYLDDVHVVPAAPSHVSWEEPLESADGTADEEATFGARLASSPPLTLPFSLSFSSASAPLWYVFEGAGQFAVTDRGILIAPPLEGGSTQIALLGGRDWRDYSVNAVVDWGLAATFSLLARMSDEDTFVTCNFSDYGGVAQIYSAGGGKTTLLAETPYLGAPAFNAWVKVPLGLSVQGDQVSCSVRGEQVLTASVKDIPRSGTVGIEVWDPVGAERPHTVRSFVVTLP